MIKNNLQSGFRKNARHSSYRKTFVSLLAGMMLTVFAGISSSANPILADDYPERYVVVKGDTLWDISSRFLRDPWRWPEVWQGNPQVENPDLIYPGDVLVMTFIDGRPVLRSLRSARGNRDGRLSPTVRASPLSGAIPSIDPSSIQAYLRAPLVTDEKELASAPYIVDGFDNRLLLGKYSQFYARGFTQQPSGDDQELLAYVAPEDGDAAFVGFAKEYNIFRPGRRFIDPISGEHLGWEAIDLGEANMLKAGDTARLTVTEGHQDITIKDRLRPIAVKEALPFFYPHAPNNLDIRGVILDTPNRSTELGALSIIAITLGERDGVDPGTVLRIKSKTIRKKDPVTGKFYSIPEEKVGLAMVFRTFEKVSYALVTDTSRQVEPGDILVSPDAE